jgi:hypothetical protein
MRLSAAVLLAALAAAAAPPAGAAGLSKADHAAIDKTLDVFVPAAVARRHPDRAWNLATAAMRLAGTRAGWARGDLPIPPFPAAGTTFHGWTVDSVEPGRVNIVLLLHPRRHAHVGSASYDIRLRKIGGRWLVDSFVPAATFAPTHRSDLDPRHPRHPARSDRARADSPLHAAPPPRPASNAPIRVGDTEGLNEGGCRSGSDGPRAVYTRSASA